MAYLYHSFFHLLYAAGGPERVHPPYRLFEILLFLPDHYHPSYFRFYQPGSAKSPAQTGNLLHHGEGSGDPCTRPAEIRRVSAYRTGTKENFGPARDSYGDK